MATKTFNSTGVVPKLHSGSDAMGAEGRSPAFRGRELPSSQFPGSSAIRRLAISRVGRTGGIASSPCSEFAFFSDLDRYIPLAGLGQMGATVATSLDPEVRGHMVASTHQRPFIYR